VALEKFEMETSIWFSKASTKANLSTFDQTWVRKMDKLCEEYPGEFKVSRNITLDGKDVGKEYTFNKKYINVRKPTTRKLTEKQKKEAGERLKKGKRK